MKKAIALILVLMMAAAAIPAFADSLELIPGTPANVPFDEFKIYFDLFTGSSGFTFIWETSPVPENGYEVYTARPENGNMEVNVYTSGGNVSHLIAEASGTFLASDEAGAEEFGQLFGAVLAGGGMGLFVAEEGIDALAAEAENYESELMPLAEILTNGMSDESHLVNGTAGYVYILGYPTGLEVNGSESGMVVSLNLKIVITSKGGQLNVVK